jgi:pilus assembly protein CpaE
VEELARVVLGMDAQDVAEEVMHFLDRTERVRVVGAASDDRQLAAAVRQLEPDVVLATPDLLRTSGRLNGSDVLAVDTQESVSGLRTAIDAGVRGFYVWPAERDALAAAAARVHPSVDGTVGQGTVVAVIGSRGGAGATFIATHLAQAYARLGRSCVLVDMDPAFAEVAAVLGTPSDPAPRTVADLVPVVDELSPRLLDDVLWQHPRGFRVLLAPPERVGLVSAGHYRRAVDVLRSTCDVVVLHLPRALDEMTRAGIEIADRVGLVLTLDVLAFHGARRVLAAFADDERIGFIVNRAHRAEIVPGDVLRVFGREPIGVLAEDRGALAAQDRGRLLPARGRTGRAVQRLARQMAEVTDD